VNGKLPQPSASLRPQSLALVCLALAIVCGPATLSAQFSDPHSYDNSPAGVNQLELGYAYAHANASLDTSLVIAGAKLNLSQGSVDYTRYFGLFHRTAWAEASLPIAGLSGSITGTNIEGSTAGTGDSSYEFATLLVGGPALTPAEAENAAPTTRVGLSVTATAPTGKYHTDKILNLGSDRWSFKPELALSLPFGTRDKWQADLYTNIYFYTDNTSYRGREVLRQEALPGFEGHVSYSFNDRVWTSLDTRYSFRGATFVNRIDQDNTQQNFSLGAETNVSMNGRNSLLFEFAKALVHENGPSVAGFSAKYFYTWGKGYH
jgi:Putative MetA-pathway of phenol degradation